MSDVNYPGGLRADPRRENDPDWLTTGIFVRALGSHGWLNVDIAQLTEESLREWLSAEPERAAHVVALLLGHPPPSS